MIWGEGSRRSNVKFLANFDDSDDKYLYESVRNDVVQATDFCVRT